MWPASACTQVRDGTLPTSLGPCSQFSSLTNLRSLVLQSRCGGSGYAPLQRLTALTRLGLETVLATPSCLTVLTLLRDLRVGSIRWQAEGMLPGEAEALAAALPRLRHLTRLDLAITSSMPTLFLTALTSLCSLWWGAAFADSSALPPGAWVRSLRTLSLPGQLLVASLPTLAEAQLERLATSDFSASHQPLLPAIFNFAVDRRSLCLLIIFHFRLQDSSLSAMQLAQRRRPDLRIVVGAEDGSLLFDGDV